MLETRNSPRAPRFGRGAFGITAAAVAVLTVLPQTGWLVREQMRGSLGGVEQMRNVYASVLGGTGGPPDPALRRVAAEHPDDLKMQIAVAAQSPRPSPNVSNFALGANDLWEQRTRFTRDPAFHATYLRFAFGASPRIGRDAEQEFASSRLTRAEAREKVSSEQQKNPPGGNRWKSDPELTRRALETAEEGTLLDPENAIFPFLKAAILFATEQDEEAYTALGVAARCSKWQEYIDVEAQGRIQLATAAFGTQSALSRIASASTILFPQYSTLRSTARVAVAGAIAREEAGDREGGLRIRRDLSRIGALMRYQSTSNIGSLVGMGITGIAGAKPNGVYLDNGPVEDSQRVVERRDAQYATYLNRIGYKAEAQWFEQERKQSDAAKKIMNGTDSGWFSTQTQVRLLCLWAVGILLLVNTLWLLLGGSVAQLFRRGQRHKEATPLLAPTRYGFAVLVAAPLATQLTDSLWQLAGMEAGSSGTFSFLVGVAVLAAPLALLWRDPSGRGQEMSRVSHRAQFRQSLGTYLKTVSVSAGVLLAVGAIIAHLWQGPLAAFALFDTLNGASGGWGEGAAPQRIVECALFALLCVLVPLTVAAVAALQSRRASVPLAMGIASAFRRIALSGSAVLLATYCVVTLATLSREQALWGEIDASVVHEGRYMAQLQGQAWPEAVPAPLETPVTTSGSRQPR